MEYDAFKKRFSVSFRYRNDVTLKEYRMVTAFGCQVAGFRRDPCVHGMKVESATRLALADSVYNDVNYDTVFPGND